MKKIGLKVIILLVVLIVGGFGIVYALLHSALPDYAGVVSLDVEDGVKVYRDDRGVAHIHAENWSDMVFAQGYVHAQERLWQMETHRRAVSGSISEIIGESMLEMDTLMRTLGLRRIAEELVEKSSDETVATMQSYVDGINSFLEEGNSTAPEFRILGFTPEPWTVEDAIGTVVLLAYNLGTNWREEAIRSAMHEELEPKLFAEILPPYDDWDTPPTWTQDQAVVAEGTVENLVSLVDRADLSDISLPGLGSNSWVVSPELSATETAVLANDPHLEQGLPSIWYENRLELNGELNLYGWSIPGAPGIVIGHNEYIAWGMTNIGDAQDLFMEEQHPDDPHRFLYDDEWYEAEVIIEEIVVKGEEEPVELEVIITRHGPLILDDPPMSLAWTAYDFQHSSADAIMDMNTARNWEEFRRATLAFSMPIQSIVYADVEGNIGFRTAGQVPIRKKGMGLVPAPGWSSEYGWDGYIPEEEMPELFNPPDGYIVTANHRVADDDYPYSIAIDYAPPYRMQRIVNELESKDRFTVADFRKLQNDWYNLHAATRLPGWVDIIKASSVNLEQPAEEGLDILEEWASNPVNLPEEPGPAIFQLWYLNFMEEVFREEMGDELYQTFIGSAYLAYNSLEYLLEKEESFWFERGISNLLLNSYVRTISQLVEEQGEEPSQWEWQQMQTISFDHIMGEVDIVRPILCRGPYPYGGDHMTVGRAAYSLKDPFKVNSVAGIRFIAVMNPAEVEAYGVMAGGQSGHFLSKHYDDQIEAWLKGDYYPLSFNLHDLAEGKTREMTINPK